MVSRMARLGSKAWWIGGGIVVVLVVAGLYLALGKGERTLSTGTTAWATGVATVGDIEVTVTGSGALQPGVVEEVRSTVSGRMHKVLAGDGDLVEQDQVLAELENNGVVVSYEQALLTYETERDRLEDMLAGRNADASESQIKTAELKVEAARIALRAKQDQVDALTVRAPSAGLVMSVEVAVGDETDGGELLLTLLEGPSARVRVLVSEDRVRAVRVGDRGSVVLAPLPEVHMMKVNLQESRVYGLRQGDGAKAIVSGEWQSGPAPESEGGEVTEVKASGTLFQATARLPGLPSTVPAGAHASLELYPSGRQDDITIIYAGGTLLLATDQRKLEAAHLGRQGHPARVIKVSDQATKDAAGEACFEVTLELDSFPEGARAGMSAHGAVWPSGGEPVFGLSTAETVTRKIVTPSGGRVLECRAVQGQRVERDQTLLVLENETLRQQLDQAANDLELQESNLRDLTAPQYTADDTKAQELKFRQAEVNLATRQDDAEALFVRAPVGGRISAWAANAVVGRQVSSGFLFCRLLNYDSVDLSLQVDELEVDQLQPGLRASVTVDALPGQIFEAEVKSVSQEGQYQQGVSKFTVVLTLESSPRLRSQMTANATIFVARKTGVLLVPAEAVTMLGQGEGEVSVVGNDGQAKARKVGVGLHNESLAEITSGLEKGATVVTGVVQDGGGFPGLHMPRAGRIIPRPQ